MRFQGADDLSFTPEEQAAIAHAAEFSQPARSPHGGAVLGAVGGVVLGFVLAVLGGGVRETRVERFPPQPVVREIVRYEPPPIVPAQTLLVPAIDRAAYFSARPRTPVELPQMAMPDPERRPSPPVGEGFDDTQTEWIRILFEAGGEQFGEDERRMLRVFEKLVQIETERLRRFRDELDRPE